MSMEMPAPPARLGKGDAARLAALVQAQLDRQAAELDAAASVVDDIPRPLRGVVKKILGM